MVDHTTVVQETRRVQWGDTSTSSAELVDQFVLHAEYGEDLSSRTRRKRWMLFNMRYPYTPQELVLEDRYRCDLHKTTHNIRLLVRVELVHRYPLARWVVLAVGDRESASNQSIANVSAPDYEGLCAIVQDGVCAEYGVDEAWDSAAWLPTVG